ncbi:hypothetical protein CXB51_005873 [Gossypium anomalum]|uniref:Integrase catalytic domain-containing protein n=1 Tax=Gossypium anomalum TaxID=47600 RepID=A0A8J6D8S3_9ROSI|nr:hypothetical protein CXB51_005873 [Gossypium anomalum]
MSFSLPPPPVFAGENYNIWALKMKTYLQAHDLWNVVLNDTEPPPLRANLTIAQIRQHSENIAKKYKAMLCLQSGVLDVIFTRIMACDSSKVVEKVITTLPEKYESKISSLEDSRDLSTIPLIELINALYAQEQRRENRMEEHSEGAFQARSREISSSRSSYKGKKPWLEKKEKGKKDAAKKKFPACAHWKKTTHLEKYCWYRPDIQRRGYKSIFRELDTNFMSKVRIGNGELIEAKGKGKAVIGTKSGNKTISEVLYVLDIDQNLLSVGQLLEKGYSLIFEGKADESSLWHRRLGHVNYKSLGLLHKMSLVEDISYICGPMKTTSLNGNRYFAVFIDDCTRFCWVGFLKQMSDVANFFCKFKALVENQDSCKLKSLRSDNETEYVSQRFQKVCDDAGIQHQLTTIYTPQQNGVCERKNRTILDMARCLLFEAKMLNNFWAEAVNTSVYLLNKLPTNAVRGKTPFEAWFGQKPIVSHLKVFGCLCYALVPAEKRTKLEKRDVKFNEVSYWKWDGTNASLLEEDQNDLDLQHAEIEAEAEGDYNDVSVRGTRTLADIYERCTVTMVEPSCYDEAARESCWQEAMEVKLRMIHKNDTWELVDRPANRKVIGVKWVFRTKNNADGSLNKHKARLVVKGYSQQQGVDFFETFAPVARLDTIRLLFALAAQKQWKAPRAWYDRIDAYLSRLGFEKCISEPTLYVKKAEKETLLIVSLNVDDLLVTGCRSELIEDFKKQMQDVFEMTDVGLMTYFLGMEANQNKHGIFINQQAFALKVISKFSMSKCKSASTPVALEEKLSSTSEHDRVDEKRYRSLVGCLVYLTATRPDIMYSVSLLSRFMHCCNTAHFKAAKRVLRYVKGTLGYGVMLERAEELKLVGYSDSDWAGSVDDMTSTSGYFFTLGSGVFSWSLKKQ